MTTMYRFACGCEWPVVGPAPREGALPLMDVDDDNLPFCSLTWDLLGRGDTKGIFQLESNLGRQWTKKLKPVSGEHMGALGAILRPGTLRAVDDEGVSMTQHFCRRKNGEEEVKSYQQMVDEVLSPTFGCLIYQEQAMLLAQRVAAFNLQEADQLRKAIGKKLPEEMAKCKKLFMEGAARAGIITEEQAKEIFDWIEKSQRYSFNKCIASNERILRPNGGRFSTNAPFTIGEMYRIRNDLAYAKATGHEQLRRKWKRLGNYGKGLSRFEDGRIRPNTIVDIRPAGNRLVYKLTLENGATIRTTGNHKFPTNRGEQTVDQMLDRMTDSVYGTQDPIMLFVCGEYEPSDFAEVGRFSDITAEKRKELSSGKRINGQRGDSNYGYTNGSYTEYTKNAAVITRECAHCGKTKGRLELHHKNGNRSESGLDNLVRLCASCHKKAEYAAGRVKRGEKGYSSLSVRLVKIEPDGKEETYDVEMAAPAHNYVTSSGIVTCNSHAVSYGLTGYDTAYIKAHFPVAFYTSWLRFAREKQDPMQEVSELVNDSKLNDVTILPPDLRNMEPHFATDGVVVTFGLSDIKGVGINQISKTTNIINEVGSEIKKVLDEWTWLDFLFFCSGRMTSSTVIRMASVNALRWFGVDRQVMLAEFDAWSELTEAEQKWIIRHEKLARGLVTPEDVGPPPIEGPERMDPKYQTADAKMNEKRWKADVKAWEKKQAEREKVLASLRGLSPFTSLIQAMRAVARTKKDGGGAMPRRIETVLGMAQLLEKPGSDCKDTPDWIAWTEQQYLGIAITCSRVDGFDQKDVNTSCKEYLAGKTGYMVFGVQVEQVREVRTKTGKNPGQKMAFLTVSDASCSISDVICFPDAWKEYSGLFTQGNCVIIQAERDPKQNSLIIKRACQMER